MLAGQGIEGPGIEIEQLGARLVDVDIDGIESLDGRERSGLVGGDERAFGDGGAADAAGDRGDDLGVA